MCSGQSAYPNLLDWLKQTAAGRAGSGQSAYPNLLDCTTQNPLIRRGVLHFLGDKNEWHSQNRSN